MLEEVYLKKIPQEVPEVPAAISVPAYTVEAAFDEHLLLEYWKVLRKRIWTVLSVLALVVFTAMIWTVRQRPLFESSTVVQIDRENPNILSFKDVFEIDTSTDDYLETAYQILQNGSLAERVITKLHLDRLPEFTSPRPWTARIWKKRMSIDREHLSEAAQIDPKYQDIMYNFSKRLKVDPVRRSRLVKISFVSFDPFVAAQVVNSLASNYIDQNLEAKWNSTQTASDWLSTQLVGLKAKLEQSEEQLQRYAKDNSILYVDDKQSISSEKLKELQEEATKAEADLAQKESLFNQIQGGDISYAPGLQENKLYQDLTAKITDLKREYSELIATFTPEYPKVKRLKVQIDEVDRALEKEQNTFARRVTNEYRVALSRKRILSQAIAEQAKQVNEIAEKSIQYNILKREAETNRQLYEGFLQRVKEASVTASLRASNIRVVEKGKVPTEAAKPAPLLNLAVAMVGGLFLGIGLAFGQEHLDNSLKSPEDVQNYLSLPVLGIIPAADSNGRRYGIYGSGYSVRKSIAESSPGNGNRSAAFQHLASVNPDAPQSEAYRSLRTAVLLSSSSRPPRRIVVTSGQPGEGKTTTVLNLGITLAQLGHSVIVIDSDLRRPHIAFRLKIPKTNAGLSTYLTGQHSVDEVIVETAVPNLFAIPCGPIPPNPAELMTSAPMSELLERLQARFQYVLLDSPPVLCVSDAQILATHVEAVILVTHGGKTPRDTVRRAKESLLRANGNVIGVVLNNLDLRTMDHEYRYYAPYSRDGSREADERY